MKLLPTLALLAFVAAVCLASYLSDTAAIVLHVGGIVAVVAMAVWWGGKRLRRG